MLASSQKWWGGGGTTTLHEITAKTYLTPAEKLTTGKKSPSVLKFSNIPCTGCPLMRKEMLGAPRSRQQLTTSSDFRRCWLMEATALGMRPGEQRTGGRHVGLWGNIHRPPMAVGGTEVCIDCILNEVTNEKRLPKLCKWTARIRWVSLLQHWMKVLSKWVRARLSGHEQFTS